MVTAAVPVAVAAVPVVAAEARVALLLGVLVQQQRVVLAAPRFWLGLL